MQQILGNKTSWIEVTSNKSSIDTVYDAVMAFKLQILTDGFPKWNTLPLEECERLQQLNDTLWVLLSYYSNLTENQNIECLKRAPQLDVPGTVQAIVLGVLFILSLIGNLLTIYSITQRQKISRQYSNSAYYLILHLSIADLLVTVTCLFGEAIWRYSVSWLADDFTCKFFKFVEVLSLYLSTFVLVLIALDRFLAVKYPMKSLRTKRKCNRLIASAWIISLCLSAPQFLIFRVQKGPFYEDFYQCVTYGFYTDLWQEQLYNITSGFLMFILPLTIIIWSYVSTFFTLARSEKMFRAEIDSGNVLPSDVNRRRLIHRAKTKSMRISVVIVVAFIICWTPYYFMMIVFMFWEPGEELANNLLSGIFCFGMSNSLVNPIIYGAFHLWRPKHRRSRTCSSRDFNQFSLRSTSVKRKPLGNGTNKTEAIYLEAVAEEDCSVTSCNEDKVQPEKPKNKKLAAKILMRYKGVFSPPSQIHL